MAASFVNTKVTCAIIVVVVVGILSCLSYITILNHPVYTIKGKYMKQNIGINEQISHVTRSNYINRKLHFTTKQVHQILWWNSPSYIGTKYNKMSLCNYSNCEIVYDRQLVEESSAIIMCVVSMGGLQQPPKMRYDRNPDQAWIFFSKESPPQMSSLRTLDSSQWNDVFNWSFTYRQDSDIFAPYGCLVEKTSIPPRNYSNVFQKKKKMAAWLVSHCHASSKRDDYVKLLQTFLDVDIYGRCGKPAPKDILDQISEEYFFYLGFENSLCRDYMTEKFFNYYRLDVINVVRGDFNYNRYLPNGSFINTADFTSVKALAKFMIGLSTNETAYSKYIKIKDKYQQIPTTTNLQDSMCSICEKLNNIDSNRKSYTNVREWFGSCRKPTDIILE